MSNTAHARWSKNLCWLLGLAFAASCKPADQSAPPAGAPPVITTKSGSEMVLIPAGKFRMGSASGRADEAPAHEVQIAAFLMDRYEMTQEQYAKYREHITLEFDTFRGSHFTGPKNPVEMIAWGAAAMLCNARSRVEGLQPCYDEETGQCNFGADGYRLPTEAEWEYACRAGADTDYYFGGHSQSLSQHAWFGENAGKKTHPVGEKKPNPWGLYDMYGNVAEWCNDIYRADSYAGSPAENPRGPKDGEKRVLRGGAWNSTADACRSAYRLGDEPGFEDACFARDALGFRCVRKAPAESGAKVAADPAAKK